MEFAGSKTEANLMAPFAGESQARNKYTYYADIAKNDGYEQIAPLFTKTADDEKAHAEIWFKLLGGIGDTKANLLAGIAGEKYEWSIMYDDFAKGSGCGKASPRSRRSSVWWAPSKRRTKNAIQRF